MDDDVEIEEEDYDGDDEDLNDELSELGEPSDSPSQKDDKEDDGAGSGGGSKTEQEQEITSHTEEKYRENEKKLFAENAKERMYAKLPKVDTKKAVMDYKLFYRLWMDRTHDYRNGVLSTAEFMKLRVSTSKAVSYLAKEFELRKNAEQLKRASTAKTGEIGRAHV